MSVDNLKEVINELEAQTLHPELIQDNKLHFSCDNIIYRVRIPNQRELLEADKQKSSYQIMLLNSENTLTLKKLKKVLKEKHEIDIDAMEEELKSSEEKMLNVYKRLGKRNDQDKEGIESDKKALADIKTDRDKLIEEISKHITPSIDVQAENYYMAYLTSICTEKNIEVDDGVKWEAVWKTFDEYMSSEDSNLKHYAMGYLTTLLVKVRQ